MAQPVLKIVGPTVSTQSDVLTVLTSAGPNFTKVWTSLDEKPRGYDLVKQVSVSEHTVTGIHELSTLLTTLEPKAKSCIIRGKFIGHTAAAAVYPTLLAADAKTGKSEDPPAKGFTFRRKDLFQPQALHYLFFDVDNYRPTDGIDPVLYPVAAINQYIAASLPAEFHDISYHWQLSGSAGHHSNAGVLKAHIAFWLTNALSSEDLTAWAYAEAPSLDITVFRTVQPNYTAAPVLLNGTPDPVPKRSALFEGHLGDAVDLQIKPAILAQAKAQTVARSDLVDPRDKPGLIGLFCRTFDIETVVSTWLSDVFSFDTEWRVSVLNSASGGVGGAGVTDTRQGIFNTHAGDPFKGSPANKWDLVRHYKFGHLDAGLSRADKVLLGIGSWPSNVAMADMVKSLPQIQAAMLTAGAPSLALTVEEASKVSVAAESHRTSIDGATSELGLREVAQRIALDSSLDRVSKDMLAAALRNKFGAIVGVKPSISAARELMGVGIKRVLGEDDGPEWLQGWLYVTSKAKFFHTGTKELISKDAFDLAFDRHMPADENGNTASAAKMACGPWKLPIVYNLMYLPSAGAIFDVNACAHANLYREDSVPCSTYDPAVNAILERHIELLVPNPEYRKHLLQWCAWVVRNPGMKVLWAVFMKGIEGDGKSVLGSMMAQAMGAENVGIISPETLAGSNFNDWAVGRCVNVIEEMKMQGHNRHDVYNKIKPLITNPRIEVHGKGNASMTAVNTTNYVGFSNHVDALPLNSGDRRQLVLFTPYGSAAALHGAILALAPSVDEYWDTLWDAVKNRPDAVRGFFDSIDVSGFKPYGRAPDTEFKQTVVGLDVTDEEAQAEHLIKIGVPGVSKHVISSACLTNALALLSPPVMLFTGQVRKLLLAKGFTPYAGGLVKWKGQPHRVWLRKASADMTTKDVRALLDESVATAKKDPAQEAADRDFGQ